MIHHGIQIVAAITLESKRHLVLRDRGPNQEPRSGNLDPHSVEFLDVGILERCAKRVTHTLEIDPVPGNPEVR